jgi:hypothetical protein
MQIHTTIKSFVPSIIVDEFRADLSQNGLTTTVEIEDSEWAHFDGGEIADIIVYIREHTTELVVTGLAAPFAYDLLKSSISRMWNLLTRVKFRKEDKDEPSKKHISLRIQDAQNRVVQIEINGNLTAENIEAIIASALTNLELSKKEQLFASKDFVSNIKNEQAVHLYYNPSTGFWEPYNFAKLSQEWDDLMKQIDELES